MEDTLGSYNYLEQLEIQFTNVTQAIVEIQTEVRTKATMERGHAKLRDANVLRRTLIRHCTSLSSYMNDFQEYIRGMPDEFTRQECDDYVKTVANGMLTYKEKGLIQKPIEQRDVTVGPVTVRMPQVAQLSQLKPAFAYYAGSDTIEAGVYCQIADGVFARVAFPHILDWTEGKKSITRCVNRVRAKCREECTYVHEGEQFARFVHGSRCPSAPFIGNLDDLPRDLERVDQRDARTLLMGGLQDTFCAALWHLSQGKPGRNNLIIYQTLDHA